MAKIAYELVAIQVEYLTMQMLRDYFNQTFSHRLDEEFIEICGWKNEEFDAETLRRIDQSWYSIINN